MKKYSHIVLIDINTHAQWMSFRNFTIASWNSMHQNHLKGLDFGESLDEGSHIFALSLTIKVKIRNSYTYEVTYFSFFKFVTGSRYQPVLEETTYKVSMRLVIHNVTIRDLGTYKCVCKNSLGDTEGTIKLYSKHYLPHF